MFDADTLSTIRNAIRLHEIGDRSPFRLSFAGLCNGGGSFGVYQGGAHADQPRIADYLRRILKGHGLPAPTIARIVIAVSAPGIENPLSDADTAAVNNALASPEGRALVTEMDSDIELAMVERMQPCLNAAAGAKLSIALEALLYIACWVNMHGAPTQLSRWIAGTPVHDLAPPGPPQLTADNIKDYLRRTAYFVRYPRNFDHLCDAVDAALA